MQLARRRIRLACDARDVTQVKDTFTGGAPDGWNSNDTQIEIGMFDADVLINDISNIQSLTLGINQLSDRKTAVITPITVPAEQLDDTVTQETWDAGIKQHAVIALTNEQFNFDLGGKTEKAFWLVVYVTTTDVPARTYTIGTAVLRILEDGAPPTGTPDPGDPLYLDADQSDARYQAKSSVLTSFVDQAVFAPGGRLTLPGLSIDSEGTPALSIHTSGSGGSPVVDIGTTNGDFVGPLLRLTHMETVVFSVNEYGVMTLGQPLGKASGGTGRTSKPVMSVRLNAGVDFASMQDAPIPFDGVESDSDGIWDGTTYAATMPRAGMALFTVTFNAGSAQWFIRLKRVRLGVTQEFPLSAGMMLSVDSFAMQLPVEADDTFSVMVVQPSGDTLTITAGVDGTRLGITYID